jgi:hypothetical protein
LQRPSFVVAIIPGALFLRVGHGGSFGDNLAPAIQRKRPKDFFAVKQNYPQASGVKTKQSMELDKLVVQSKLKISSSAWPRDIRPPLIAKTILV